MRGHLIGALIAFILTFCVIVVVAPLAARPFLRMPESHGAITQL